MENSAQSNQTKFATQTGNKSESWASESEKGSRESFGIKRDMVNYKALEGHQYEIKPNPQRDSCKNTRIYVWKYDDCNKEFSKTWNLIYHFRVHTKEKPFKCSQWPKSFTQNSNLKKHFVMHLSEDQNSKKVHECDVCQKKYSSCYYLQTHRLRAHPENK